MRDGASLYTAIYTPKDQSKKYPIIMQRTPYSARHMEQPSLKEHWSQRDYDE
jgi:predicted acyl esterase